MKKLLVIATLWLPCMLNGMDTILENSDSLNPDLYLPRPEDTPVWRSLRKLVFSNINFESDVENVKSLFAFPYLETLELNNIFPIGLVCLSIESMQPKQSLKELTISNCEQLRQFDETFFTKFPNLEKFCLNQCTLLEDDTNLPESICTLHSLKHIEIKNNKGINCHQNFPYYMTFPKDFFKKCNQLQSIDFSNPDDKRCAIVLFSLSYENLYHCKNLQELYLTRVHESYVQEDVSKHLKQALPELTKLRKLDLSCFFSGGKAPFPLPEKGLTNLQYLHLRGVSRKIKQQEILPDLLPHYTNLEELNLSDCLLGYRIDSKWSSKLINTLEKLKKLKKLNLSENCLYNLVDHKKFYNNDYKTIERHIPHEKIIRLLKILCTLPALESVDLSNNSRCTGMSPQYNSPLVVPKETFNALKLKLRTINLEETIIEEYQSDHQNENKPTQSPCGLF